MYKPGDLVISTIHICDCDAPPTGRASRRYTNICVEENEIGLVLENHHDHYTILFGSKIIRVWNWIHDIKKYEGAT
jgi:hypothetical protein